MISKKDITKLESLMYLYALSKAGSKREVAEKMGTSVDTINKYIADLEAEMKTFFLVSNGRGTVITPEGERMLHVAEDIVKSLRSIGDYADMATAYKGTVRLGMPDAIADYLGADDMFEFMREYPDIHVENHIGAKLPNMVTMEADICLNYEPPMEADLVLVRSKKIPCGLYASRKYLDLYGEPKSMDDMLENHRICDKTNHLLYVDGWKESMAKAKHLVYKTNSIFSLRSVLEKGGGVGILPTAYESQNLIRVLEKEFGFDINIYLITHRATKDMPRIRVVLDYIKKVLDEKYENKDTSLAELFMAPCHT